MQLVLNPPLSERVRILRAAIASCVEESGVAPPHLVARADALEQIATLERGRFEGLPFRERYPALARWATNVLSQRGRRRTPLEIAAAYELLAVEASESGAFDLADRALAHAADVIETHAA